MIAIINFFINLLLSVPLLTGALFLCYNKFERFRTPAHLNFKLLFGVAFFIFRIKPFTLENTSDLIENI